MPGYVIPHALLKMTSLPWQTILQYRRCHALIRVFPKWNRNSVNSANSRNVINHRSMKYNLFKDCVSRMCLIGTVVASWFLTQEVAGLSPFKPLSCKFRDLFTKQTNAITHHHFCCPRNKPNFAKVLITLNWPSQCLTPSSSPVSSSLSVKTLLAFQICVIPFDLTSEIHFICQNFAVQRDISVKVNFHRWGQFQLSSYIKDFATSLLLWCLDTWDFPRHNTVTPIEDETLYIPPCSRLLLHHALCE